MLDLEDDTVRANWGGTWHMPTETQFRELIDNTNGKWTTVNNTKGYTFTSKTDSSKYIFIPAAGGAHDGNQSSVDILGFVWSSSLYSSGKNSSLLLLVNSDSTGVYRYNRNVGRPVRGVIG